MLFGRAEFIRNDPSWEVEKIENWVDLHTVENQNII